MKKGGRPIKSINDKIEDKKLDFKNKRLKVNFKQNISTKNVFKPKKIT